MMRPEYCRVCFSGFIGASYPAVRAPGRTGGGGPLLYQNFYKRFWRPAFKRLKLPYVTPHAARHGFISVLQSQGVEVGLVAKLAGHANANVTLGHYTQAVRGGADAMAMLEAGFTAVEGAPHG